MVFSRISAGPPCTKTTPSARCARPWRSFLPSSRLPPLRTYPVRIGIATGPVVVGEAAGAGDQSRLAVGSTPNLAARLQGLATADQIVIATSTRRLVGNAFDFNDLGEHDLKGIAGPVHAWRVERLAV